MRYLVGRCVLHDLPPEERIQEQDEEIGILENVQIENMEKLAKEKEENLRLRQQLNEYKDILQKKDEELEEKDNCIRHLKGKLGSMPFEMLSPTSQLSSTSQNDNSLQPSVSYGPSSILTDEPVSMERKGKPGRKSKSQLLKEDNDRIVSLIETANDTSRGLEVRILSEANKGRAVFSTRAFAHGDFLVEYAGDLLDAKEAEKKEEEYKEDPTKGSYVFYFESRYTCIFMKILNVISIYEIPGIKGMQWMLPQIQIVWEDYSTIQKPTPMSPPRLRLLMTSQEFVCMPWETLLLERNCCSTTETVL